MDNLDLYLDNLRTYLNRVSFFLLSIEAISGLLAGALLGSDIASGDYHWYTFLICILFFITVLLHAFSNALFPSQALRSIELSKSLNECESELSRMGDLFKQIDGAVETLNKRTCAIQPLSDTENGLDVVKDNLNEILSGILLDPNTMFKCSASKFTIIARVSYVSMESDRQGYINDYAVLRDDLSLEKFLKKDIIEQSTDVFEDLQSIGLRREIGNFLRKIYNENCYASTAIESKNDIPDVPESGFTFVGVPIPLICEGSEANGVLLIVADSSFDCAGDIPAVLKTHGRLIANWLGSYEKEVLNSMVYSES